MTTLHSGEFRPSGSENKKDNDLTETSQVDPENIADDVLDTQDTNPPQAEIPQGVKLPGSESLTPHEALGGITHGALADAEGTVTASRVEAPESWVGRLQHNRVARGVGKAAAFVTIVGVAAGIGAKVAGGEDDPAPAPQATHSVPAKTEPIPSASTQPTEAPKPTPTKTIETRKPDRSKALEAMEPAVFETQTRSERLAWGGTKLTEVAVDGRVSYAFVDPETFQLYTFGKTQVGADGKRHIVNGTDVARSNPVPHPEDPSSGTPLSKTSSGEEIFKYNIFMQQLIGAWGDEQGANYDAKTGQKLISLKVATPASKLYKNEVDSVKNTTDVTTLKDADFKDFEYLGATKHYEIPYEGKLYPAITIRYKARNGINDVELIFEEVPTLGAGPNHKKEPGAWLETKRSEESIKPGATPDPLIPLTRLN